MQKYVIFVYLYVILKSSCFLLHNLHVISKTIFLCKLRFFNNFDLSQYLFLKKFDLKFDFFEFLIEFLILLEIRKKYYVYIFF